VFIRPGMLASQELTFKGQGNEQPNQAATDLVVSFTMLPDNLYRRQGDNDLIYTHKTSLADVVQCKPVQLTTLDGRRLLISVDQVMSPNNVKLVEGEGLVYDTGMRYEASDRERMQMQKLEGKRGDLYILFDIEFPKLLSKDQKSQIESLLQA
jgi:DnaJ homolog subfamily B member 4